MVSSSLTLLSCLQEYHQERYHRLVETSNQSHTSYHNWYVGLFSLNDGWFHCNISIQNWLGSKMENVLNHHLVRLLGLGSLSWEGVKYFYSPTNQFLDVGVDVIEIPLPHGCILNLLTLFDIYQVKNNPNAFIY
jgi:hypothetical protein